MPPCQPCRACPCHGLSLRPTARHMGHRAVLRERHVAGSTGARGAGGRARDSVANMAADLRAGAKGGSRAAVPAGSVSGRRRCRCIRSALVGSSRWRTHRLGAELSCAPAPGWSSATCPQGRGVPASWVPGARTGRGGRLDGAPQRGWPVTAATAMAIGDAAGAGAMTATVPHPWPCRARAVSWAWAAAHDMHWPSFRAGTGAVRGGNGYPKPEYPTGFTR
jgi:hypothetical protein